MSMAIELSELNLKIVWWGRYLKRKKRQVEGEAFGQSQKVINISGHILQAQ